MIFPKKTNAIDFSVQRYCTEDVLKKNVNKKLLIQIDILFSLGQIFIVDLLFFISIVLKNLIENRRL